MAKKKAQKRGRRAWTAGTRQGFFAQVRAEYEKFRPNKRQREEFGTTATAAYLIAYAGIEANEEPEDNSVPPWPSLDEIQEWLSERRKTMDALPNEAAAKMGTEFTQLRGKILGHYNREVTAVSQPDVDILASILRPAAQRMHPRRVSIINAFTSYDWERLRPLVEEELQSQTHRAHAEHRRRLEDDPSAELKLPERLTVQRAVVAKEMEEAPAELMEKVLKQREERYEEEMEEWEASANAFDPNAHTEEDYREALKKGAGALQLIVDAVHEHLGMNCSIFVTGPNADKGGRIHTLSAHAGTAITGGLRWHEDTPEDVKTVHELCVKFAKKVYTEADCRARLGTGGTPNIESTPEHDTGHTEVEISTPPAVSNITARGGPRMPTYPPCITKALSGFSEETASLLRRELRGLSDYEAAREEQILANYSIMVEHGLVGDKFNATAAPTPFFPKTSMFEKYSRLYQPNPPSAPPKGSDTTSQALTPAPSSRPATPVQPRPSPPVETLPTSPEQAQPPASPVLSPPPSPSRIQPSPREVTPSRSPSPTPPASPTGAATQDHPPPPASPTGAATQDHPPPPPSETSIRSVSAVMQSINDNLPDNELEQECLDWDNVDTDGFYNDLKHAVSGFARSRSFPAGCDATFIRLTHALLLLEARNGYDESTGKLPTAGRPDVVAFFMRHHRRWERPQDIGKLDVYTKAWWSWWRSCQPDGRRDNDVLIRPKEVSWEGLDMQTGRNGLVLVLGTLLWWGESVFASENAQGHIDWAIAVCDVTWALENMLAYTEGPRRGKRKATEGERKARKVC